VLMLPQQHGILLDGLVRDRIMRLLLVRVAQSASGVESKFYFIYFYYYKLLTLAHHSEDLISAQLLELCCSR
jgi:hypothetical protein